MIVFLHGWLMDAQMWPKISSPRSSHRTLFLSQPAHGPAPGPDVAWTMDDWCAWVEQQIGDIDPRELILVGHSMGGMLAQALALRRRPAALILVGTTAQPWPPEIQQSWLGLVGTVENAWSSELAAQLAPLLLGRGFLQTHPAWLESWVTRVAAWSRRGMMNLAHAAATRPDISTAVAAIGVPTLVIHGQADASIPHVLGEDLAQRTGGELLSLPDVGHCAPLEGPEIFATTLQRFVASL